MLEAKPKSTSQSAPPWLTIVTPTLNSATHIRIAIESVMAQACSGVEHLIIDGRSTDETLSIARSYPQVTVLSEPDEGIYQAMNKGIEKATGTWLYFMGADDTFYDNQVLNEIRSHFTGEVDVIYGDVTSDRFDGIYDGPFDVRKIYEQNICHQAIFFHRSLFDVTGPFDERYRSHADWDHNMKWLLSKTIRSKYIDRIIANYSDGGFSSVTPDPKFKEEKVFNFLQYCEKPCPVWFGLKNLSWEAMRSLKHRNTLRFQQCIRMMPKVMRGNSR